MNGRLINSQKRLNKRFSNLVCVALLLTGGFACRPSAEKQHITELIERTKMEHRAADIQAAMLPIFLNDRTFTNPLPREICSLPIFSDAPSNITISATDSSNVAVITVGSGFGHWGILVVTPNHDTEISDWHRERLIPWEKGIYFYSDYK